MSGILQFFILLGLFAVVWYLGYRKGKTIKERELKDMEYPELTKEEEEELSKLGYLD